MKTIYGVFATAVFVISLAQPAFACGGNPPRGAKTTATAPAPSRPAPSSTGGAAQGAGVAR